MIINENNKNEVLKGMTHRGFNQTPAELRENLFNKSIKPTIKETKVPDLQKQSQPQNLRETMNALRRLK